MCSESDVTCSVIYPMVCGLINTCLVVEDTDSSLISRIKETKRGELDKHYQPTATETAKSTPVLASLLYPRYKGLPFLSRDQRKIAEETLESRMDEAPLRLPSHPRDSDKDCVKCRANQENSDELQRYLLVKMEPNAKALDLWKRHDGNFRKSRMLLGCDRLTDRLSDRLTDRLSDRLTDKLPRYGSGHKSAGRPDGRPAGQTKPKKYPSASGGG
ncbi:hypothetical protein DPMN_062562 [Dreissena polymorpha]|uniref:Uncharacterized protein n=1 Tax=Dreissena polymorpha TaxID=45954 RepID=A0A9D4C9F1_DREPO|nr:hypothetical protein DPMN_062562 [Dreissena polymorpha]